MQKLEKLARKMFYNKTNKTKKIRCTNDELTKKRKKEKNGNQQNIKENNMNTNYRVWQEKCEYVKM